MTRSPGFPPVLKRFGQHFLTDERILARIVDVLAPEAGDTVVEVGAGRGSLTELLAVRAGRVVAVEIDRALAQLLRNTFSTRPHVEIVEGDVLATNLTSLANGKAYKLVGNVPYYITTPILFKAIEIPRPTRAVFLVQNEVAERVAAEPGSKAYGALSVNLQAVATPTIAFRVKAGAFLPPPKVDSAVLCLEPRAEIVPLADTPEYRALTQGAFGLRRKQLLRVVRTLYSLGPTAGQALLDAAELKATIRPEVISPEGYGRLLAAATRIGARLIVSGRSGSSKRS